MPRSWQEWAAVALGVLFLFAGVSKVLDPWSFHATLPDYGITGAIRTLVSLLVPALEVVLGVSLVMRWRVRRAAAVAGAFLALFIVAIGVGWWRGTLEECGCFGAMLERSPGEAIAIDLVFLVLAVVVWRVAADEGRSYRKSEWQRKAVLVGTGAGALVLTVSLLLGGPSGVRAAEVSDPHPEMESVELDRGEHLLYLFHHECPQCAKMSPVVASYSGDASLPPVVGFTTGTTRAEIDTYRDTYGLRIPVQTLPRKLFGRITGTHSVPQLVHVRNGAIARTWASVFPDAGELRTVVSAN